MSYVLGVSNVIFAILAEENLLKKCKSSLFH